MTGIDFFEVSHAWIGEEFGVELGASHIHAHDIRGAGLKHAVGEAAGGGADVEYRVRR